MEDYSVEQPAVKTSEFFGSFFCQKADSLEYKDMRDTSLPTACDKFNANFLPALP